MRRGAAALALALALGGCAHVRAPGALPVGQPLHLSLWRTDGTPVDWSPKPGRVSVVVFWASWCAPCLSLLRSVARHGSFDLVAVNVDADVRFTKRDAQRLKLPRPVLRDPEGRAARELGVRTLPTSLVVDRRGRIARVLEGDVPGAATALESLVADVRAEGNGA